PRFSARECEPRRIGMQFDSRQLPASQQRDKSVPTFVNHGNEMPGQRPHAGRNNQNQRREARTEQYVRWRVVVNGHDGVPNALTPIADVGAHVNVSLLPWCGGCGWAIVIILPRFHAVEAGAERKTYV